MFKIMQFSNVAKEIWHNQETQNNSISKCNHISLTQWKWPLEFSLKTTRTICIMLLSLTKCAVSHICPHMSPQSSLPHPQPLLACLSVSKASCWEEQHSLGQGRGGPQRGLAEWDKGHSSDNGHSSALQYQEHIINMPCPSELCSEALTELSRLHTLLSPRGASLGKSSLCLTLSLLYCLSCWHPITKMGRGQAGDMIY